MMLLILLLMVLLMLMLLLATDGIFCCSIHVAVAVGAVDAVGGFCCHTAGSAAVKHTAA